MDTPSFLSTVTGKVNRRELALGAVVNLPEPSVTEVLATCGYDFLWIDSEHSTMGKAEINRHIVAARSRSVAPFVRVPWNDPVLAKPILEMGPAAIIFPFVTTAEGAERAVAACRYPPRGVRGFGPQRANLFGSIGLTDYLALAEIEPWVVVQIEHIDAVRNLNAICSVEGLGSLCVGPFDLSASVGKAGRTSDPEVIELEDEIGRVARERGVPFGAFAISSDRDSVDQWIGRGASWLAVDTDIGMLTRAARAALAEVRPRTTG